MNPQAFFEKATGFQPYPYQLRLATCDELPEVLSVPTGVGKTAAAVLAWLYRRREAATPIRVKTPRRLVYCLPMRTLVEQTRDAAQGWLERLGLLTDDAAGVGLHLLMGGEDDSRWYEWPERDAILIGTQDMLLSRALNRGYGMSRYRWPVDFSLLHNDAFWVLDETQLMGVGLTTSAQLAGLRQKLFTYFSAPTMWMSATLDADSLVTIDHPKPESGWSSETIEQDDKEHQRVSMLLSAAKACQPAEVTLTPDSKKTYAPNLTEEITRRHMAGTLTLVVVNRVQRAQEVYASLKSVYRKHDAAPEITLIHSRFRPVDRGPNQAAALDETSIPDAGRIIIATQAIEAGVDISATTLFTELAPWSSLVQRFGRCNRRGICGVDGRPSAQVIWVDVDTSDPKRCADLTLPYDLEATDAARRLIADLSDLGPESLLRIEAPVVCPIHHVLRRKDLLDLFDTTADLSGNDLDVSRYIRDTEDSDVQVYWRYWDLGEKKKNAPPTSNEKPGDIEFPPPTRDELCSVPIAALRGTRGFVNKIGEKDLRCFTWNPLDNQWQVVRPNDVRPGMILLTHCKAGGYDSYLGWTGDPKHTSVSDCRPSGTSISDAMDAEDLSGTPMSITEHLRDVGTEAEQLVSLLSDNFPEVPWSAIIRAAWWHDVGKAHPAFQGGVLAANPALDSTMTWAKSGMQGYLRYQIPNLKTQSESEGASTEVATKPQTRRGFRHELASALAWMQQNEHEHHSDLIAYLIAAHHGKVRISIRSMPNEDRPPEAGRYFARGVWDGDVLPRIEIGNDQGDTSGKVALSLALMQLGQQNECPSWLARTTQLLEQYGPFRLAYLEMLVRVADWRGSKKGAK